MLVRGQLSNSPYIQCKSSILFMIKLEVGPSNKIYAFIFRRSASSEITCDEEVGKNGCSEMSLVENIDLSSPVWLHSSNWNPSHETVVLVHGYGGFSDTLPTGVLKQGWS